MTTPFPDPLDPGPDAPREAHRQAALLRLSTRIAAARDESEVCQSVVDGLRDPAVGYDFVGVFLIDPETGDRVLRASVGWEGAHEGYRLTPGHGLSERPILDGHLHYSGAPHQEPGYVSGAAHGSELDLPLYVDDEVVGVLVVESDQADAFGEEDFRILTAASQQAGIAIGRARLLHAERQRSQEQRALLDTMQDLSSELELSRLLHRVVQRAVTLLGVTGGELAIYDEEARELEIVASHNIGSDSIGTRMKLGEGGMGMVAQTREPLIIPNYLEWEHRSSKYADTTARGVAVVPLMIGSRLVGTLASVHTDGARTFGPEDLRLLNLFAPQAAIAIDNARLYTEAQSQRQYFETLVSNSPVAIVVADLDGRIVALNPAFERLFGWSPAEAVGLNLDDLINTQETMDEAVGYTDAAASGKTLHAIGRRRRKDGQFIEVELAACSVQVRGEQTGILALYHDVSELLEARREAEEANQAKSRFLANMSHELRTPLNAIIGYSEMLAEEAEEVGQEDFIPDLEKVQHAGRHLLALINDILDLSKIEAGKMELFLEELDLRKLVEEVASTIEPMVRRNANRLVMELPEELPPVTVDHMKLRQILLNLLSNASKFTQDGTVTLSVRPQQTRGVEWLQISVEDSGIGMTDRQLERIFEAFGQADASTTKRFGGTGLGLVISRQFALLMGGDIFVDSTPGEGSVFTLRLPRTVRPSGAEAPPSDPPAPDAREEASARG